MTTDSKTKTVLYFGIFDPYFSRNRVYIDGLRKNGVKVMICADRSPGLRKFWNLWKAHQKLRGSYDLMIVGYASYLAVPLARLIATAPVAFDTLCSFYEAEIISRDAFRGNPFRIPYVRFVDWISTRSANFVFIETERQKEYFFKELGVKEKKLIVVYTGVDDSVFHADRSVPKLGLFTVLFRGRINKEAGANHVLRAAKILEKENIDFLIIGYGWDAAAKDFDALFEEIKPANVRHIKKQFPLDDLPALMLGCHASLGQLEDNERLSRTIPHKAFESLAMRLPYITARATGVSEVFTDGKDCLMVKPADPEDLAAKVRMLRDSPALAIHLADAGFALYKERFTPENIVRPIIELLNRIS